MFEAIATLEIPVERVVYEISEAEAREVAASLPDGRNDRATTLLQLCGWFIAALSRWIFLLYRHSVADILLAIGLTLMFLDTLWTLIGKRSTLTRSIIRRGDLSLGESISGSMDGKPVKIQWHDVSVARKLPNGTIVLDVRATRLPRRIVAIPPRALGARGTQVWALVDDRLTAKRYLVRSTTRTKITNTSRLAS